MGCNCKAKQKIKLANKYFGVQPRKNKEGLETPILQAFFLWLMIIVLAPFILIFLIIKACKKKNRTIHIDKLFLKAHGK